MSKFSLRASVAVSILALGAAAAAGVVAATQPSSDEQALQPTRQPADRRIESRVNDLLAKMTLEEKLQQIQLLPDFLVTDEGVKKGLGSVLSVTDPQRIRDLQRMAVEESRLKIPILFAFDTIHGFRTIFPIPLAAGASFDPQVVFDDHKYGARESAVVGLKQTYAPMVDVSHEPRWGRISEGAGEDPYLNSVLAAARVKAIQGSDYSAPDKLVASPKHFAAYGQPEGGRDYGTTDMSEQRLRNLYLPPFKAAIDAGADTAMCSFNAINGVPGCGNDYLMNQILKGEWDFDGFVEGDWTAVAELRACPPKTPDTGECGHGVAADGPGRRGACPQLRCGLRDDQHADPRLRRTAARRAPDLDEADRRRGAQDPARQVPRRPVRAPVRTVHARPGRGADAAARRGGGRAQGGEPLDGAPPNEGGILPLDPAKKTAVIGPLAKNQHDMLGPWWGAGRDSDAVTVFDGINEQSPGATYAEGCKLSNTEPPHTDPEGCGSEADFAEAVAVAKAADQVVLALGETREMSGEAAARSTLDLPGRQDELIRAIKATGKPFVVVLFNGRPLALEDVIDDTPALLEAWFPGVQAGPAVADVVFGKVNPGGKLPVSFPRRLGQVPIYYNHEPAGRPCNPDVKWNSRYRDIPSCSPLYEFGYGLSYTTFEVSDLQLSSSTVSSNRSLTASVTVKNTGSRKGDEVVQLYIHDPVASISQPVRRLRGFERVTLNPGKTQRVTFTLDKSDFGFYDNRGKFVVEPGQIDVYAGNSSSAELTQSFTVQG